MISKTLLSRHYQCSLMKFRLYSTIKDNSLEEANSYCVELVRSKDYESFLAGLLVPKQQRNVYYVIKAFNVEIATIKDQIPRNHIQAGKIRFQFWKDVLQQIYSKKQLSPSINQPVAQALAYHINHHNLTLRWFERMLEARFQDMLKPGDFNTMNDLELYAENSHSSQLYLMLEALQIKDENTEFIASHVGVCKGLITLLRGHMFHISQGSCYFPDEILIKHSFSKEVAFSDPSKWKQENLIQYKNVVNDIASQAFAHLSQAQVLSKQSFIKKSKYALFPVVSSSIYLSDLQKDDFALPSITSNVNESHFYFLRLQLKLLWYLCNNGI